MDVSRDSCRTRHVEDYKALLMAADAPRLGDLDGCGALSSQALTEFREFFLTVCIDQVEYMSSLLQPKDLLRRKQLHIQDEVQAGFLLKGSFPVLREALLPVRSRAAVPERSRVMENVWPEWS